MKKVFPTLLLALTLIFVGGQFNQAEARDYYVGTWRSGYDAYLMTETMRTGPSEFKCTVKAVKGRDTLYINYNFWMDRGWIFSNSDGVTSSVDTAVSKGSSIESNIVRYYYDHY